MRYMRFLKAAFGAAAVASVAGLALAAGPGYGCDPASMGAYGGRMYGAGPPMMGGYGPGAMRGYGPGMMGDYGPGFGPGMMYSGDDMQSALGLSEDQRKKLNAVHDDLSAKVWDIMGKMRVEMNKMRDLASADPLDKAALDASYKRMSELRQARFDAHIAARTEIDALLTREQREHLRGFGRWWLSQAD